jgi:AcrR family transcriptional regulator
MAPVVERLTPERRREMTRNALVEAATEVFARRGFHAATLEEIAEAAGFTRGAIYSNFSSKEELLLAVVDRHFDALLEAFSGVLTEHAGADDEGKTASAALLTYRVHRDEALMLLGLEFRLYAARNPEFRARLAELDRRHAERVAAFIEEETAAAGVTMAIPARDLAELSRAATDGLAQYAAVDRERADEYDRLTAKLFELLSLPAASPSTVPTTG